MGGLSPAAVRIYARCREIECEAEEAIDDAEPLEVLLERCERIRERTEVYERTGNYDDLASASEEHEYETAKAKTKAEMLARHREYQWRKAELGRLLQLGPEDIGPLDLNFDQEWESAADPRIEVWRRACELRYRLDQAHLDLILWWRSPPPVHIVNPREATRHDDAAADRGAAAPDLDLELPAPSSPAK
jgi:hypothetical protein